MFDKIQELIDDPDALVCVLIDEVRKGGVCICLLVVYLFAKGAFGLR